MTTALAKQETLYDAVDFSNWDIGRKLREMREAKGLIQAEVARRARMRPEVLNRLEKGRGNPTVRTVQRVLRAMGYRA